jgi:hypothetical protein
MLSIFGDTSIFGKALTVIIVEADELHPLASMPETVYVVLALGERMVEAELVVEIFAEGDQE